VLWRKKGETRDQFNFKVAVSILMVLGLLLLTFSDRLPSKPLVEIVRSLGEAVFIATVLAATVDLYVKQRTYREISADIFKFLIGYGLPDEFKNRIRELVTNSDLIRSECTIEWTLEPVQGEPNSVKLGYSVVYKLSNISDRAVRYQFKTSRGVDDPVETTVTRLWGRSPNSNASYEMTGADLTPEAADETGREWIRGKAFEVPADSVRHGLEFSVGAEYESKLSGRQFDYHGFAAPTLGASVTVRHPQDFKIYLSPPLSPPHKPRLGTVVSTWKYDRLFFTHDAIFIRWSRIPPPVSASNALKGKDMSGTKVIAPEDRNEVE
jgi:hypothetical protein